MENTAPIYDCTEPIYLFMRRWDNFIQHKGKMQLYTDILEIINILFESNYTKLLSIKNICSDIIPPTKTIIKIINNKTCIDIKYNKKTKSCEIINELLNKIEYAFVPFTKNNKIYYNICNINN